MAWLVRRAHPFASPQDEPGDALGAVAKQGLLFQVASELIPGLVLAIRRENLVVMLQEMLQGGWDFWASLDCPGSRLALLEVLSVLVVELVCCEVWSGTSLADWLGWVLGSVVLSWTCLAGC